MRLSHPLLSWTTEIDEPNIAKDIRMPTMRRNFLTGN